MKFDKILEKGFFFLYQVKSQAVDGGEVKLHFDACLNLVCAICIKISVHMCYFKFSQFTCTNKYIDTNL